MITIVRKVNQYRKSSGPVFVYELTGTDAELKEYKAIQKDNYREDETTKKPLWFSNVPLTNGQELSKTRDNSRFVILTDLEATATRSVELQEKEMAKLKALQQFTGMTPQEIMRAVLAA